MTSAHSPGDQELQLELLRDIHDRLREIAAVDDAMLGELRHLVALLGRPTTRRADQGRY